jgi:hypothetical protein
MENIEFNTTEQCKTYLKLIGKKSKSFYLNIYGWNLSYSIKPTWCTPTGKFKKTQLIKL